MIDKQNPEISGILNNRISENLSSEGFNSIIIDGETSVTDSIGNALFIGAFFIIEIIHVNNTEGIFSVRAYSTWDGAFIGEERAVITNFNDDAYISLGLSLVPILNEKLKTEEALVMAEKLRKALEADTVSEPEVPDVETADVDTEPDKPAVETAIAEEEINTLEQTAAEEPVPAVDETTTRSKNGGLVLLESGAFISSFNAAEYFSTAFSATLKGYYRFVNKRISYETGGLINFIPFTMKGAAAEAESYMCSLGCEMGIESKIDGDFFCFYRIAGGGSYLFMNTTEQGLLKKLLPFASGEIGSGLMLGEHWSLALAVNYSIFFEESLLINGFTPSLGINYLW